VQRVVDRYPVSERRACRLLSQPRTTQRYQPIVRDDEEPLTAAIIELASQYGRYGYRRITALLRAGGWYVNHKRVERLPCRARWRSQRWLGGPAPVGRDHHGNGGARG